MNGSTDGEEEAQIAAKLRSGSVLTQWGVFILVVSVLGTCVAGALQAGHTAGQPLQASSLIAVGLSVAIALIAVGQARRSNAKRAADDLFKARHTTIKVVPDASIADGPFRGAMKEVAELDPSIAAAERAEIEDAHRRGARSLWIGGMIMVVTLAVIMKVMVGSADQGMSGFRDGLVALGLGAFPFGLGLFFAIRGALLRSK